MRFASSALSADVSCVSLSPICHLTVSCIYILLSFLIAHTAQITSEVFGKVTHPAHPYRCHKREMPPVPATGYCTMKENTPQYQNKQAINVPAPVVRNRLPSEANCPVARAKAGRRGKKTPRWSSICNKNTRALVNVTRKQLKQTRHDKTKHCTVQPLSSPIFITPSLTAQVPYLVENYRYYSHFKKWI